MPRLHISMQWILAAAITAVGFNTCGHAAVISVSPFGNGGTPHLTIQSGLDAAAEGDTVIIGHGNYTGLTERFIDGATRGAVAWIDKSVTLIAEPRSMIEVPESGLSYAIYSTPAADSVVLQNLRITTDALGISFSGSALVVESTITGGRGQIHVVGDLASVTIRDCEFLELETTAFLVANGSADVRSCRFTGSGLRGARGFGIFHDSHATVVDCTFSNISIAQVQGPNASLHISTSEAERVSAPALQALYQDGRIYATDVSIVGDGDADSYSVALEAKLGGHVDALRVRTDQLVDAVVVQAGGTVSINDCDLSGYSRHSVSLFGFTAPPRRLIDLRHNFWGTADSFAIAESIIDGSDDPHPTTEAYGGNPYGTVIFWPVLSKPVLTQPSTFGSLKKKTLERSKQ